MVKIKKRDWDESKYMVSPAILITDEEDREMHGISECDIRIRIDEIVKAKLKIAVSDINLDELFPVFVIQHPITGEEKQIKEIIFVDETKWEAK